jgi:hypothetical protein
MAKTKSFVVEIELTENQVKAISDRIPAKLTDAQKIAGVATSTVFDIADGGVSLSGDIFRQIIAVTGDIVDNQDLVKFVEAGKGMDAGRKGYPWYPDPTYVPVLEENARMQATTVEQLVQDIMDYGTGQGWGYALAPDVSMVFFSKEDMEMVRGILNQTMPTGTSISEWIRNTAKAKQVEANAKVLR